MFEHTVSPAAAPRALACVPGPRGLPWLGNALQIELPSFHRQLEAWAAEYNGCFSFRIGPRRFLVITEPERIAWVLRQRPDTFLRSRRIERVASSFGFSGLFSANGDRWRRQRPMVLAGLDPTHIRNYLPALAGVTARLRSRWSDAARTGAPVDLLSDLMRYTVDVTSCLAFGRDLNTLEQNEERAIQRHLNAILPRLFRRIVMPFDLPRWLARGTDRHVEALRSEIHGFIADTRAQIAARPQLSEHPENLIQGLVAARDRPGSQLTDEEVCGNVLTMLLAGEDTTATTLAWLIWLLSRNPQATRAAREAVDRVLGAGVLPGTVEQLAELDHLQACANEAMRLKPVAPLLMQEAAADVTVGDVRVPRGAFVLCLMRPAGLDARRFPEPQRFDPQRWLGRDTGAGDAVLAARRILMPFGAGPRVCPGRYLALTEIKLVISMLLGSFELENVSTESGGEPRERLAMTMAPVGLRMRLRLRDGALAS